MGPGHFWWVGGFFFSIIILILIIVIILAIIRCIFWRRHFPPPPWLDACRPHPLDRGDSETAIDILNKRYAKGEITKEEFEQIKKDIIS